MQAKSLHTRGSDDDIDNRTSLQHVTEVIRTEPFDTKRQRASGT